MTAWLERIEKISCHQSYIDWRRRTSTPAIPNPPSRSPTNPNKSSLGIKMTCNPSVRSVPLDDLAVHYGTIDIRNALASFIAKWNDPSLTGSRLNAAAARVNLPMRTLPVFHKIRFSDGDECNLDDALAFNDVAHIKPASVDSQGRPVPARFDTVLVDRGNGGSVGVKGYQVAQVRAVFLLSNKTCRNVFSPGSEWPNHLAYVEWFSPFSRTPHRDHTKMYKVSREVQGGERRASVIPVHNIKWTVMLFPMFGTVADRSWSSDTVLDKCSVFYMNILQGAGSPCLIWTWTY
ncbi:hypothetical protein QCA50_018648 [Cerrena zonata]|uniref:DUF6830 domain-containing protein n=1 Tax=Cerrena zonata TaxID=2478898 RepID=A0AAW0FAJ5_9APHY